ncbi:hypothetical protein WH52_10565 [Tenacibaculum holothuriorum]|uniref:Beta-lactamase-inhibitor-like PepSY-like domain-containing protein n=2 Tax=Tenacibaculum holothuriorum TaxID=1635173 RepID=A0A1Y2PAT9_9FLAO|nr:hypothetical protein WH52_10565 [Tenacibaculum holothuriorum]
MRIFVLLVFSVALSAFSQQKFEREYRIKIEEVPAEAKAFINKCKFDKKVKWYAEESQDGKTIEAKSCKNKYKYSVEFSSDGKIIDIEKTVKWKEIQKETKRNIKQTLSQKFKKFKIKKAQIQWKTDEDTYLKLMNRASKTTIKELFELIVKGKKESSYNLYEILFDTKGNIVKELKFAPQNTDNLEF